MKVVTADLWDQYSKELKILNLELKSYGKKTAFCGEVVTLKVFEDNSFVRKTLEDSGKGKVLIIDGGGSKRCALIGDNIAKLANDNNWEGIIVYGCIRDSKVINEMNVSIKAIGTCPAKSSKRNVGVSGEMLIIEGTQINQGEYVYSDEDGVLLSKRKCDSI
ncbi:ribonuclease E activity regulator RraA [Aquimarina algicola]|uniref:4-hydroxy-4-methyl-2-oxoglutarate aldolase n=1 Tax=Aquimarina algicola TaxID=2589995 RepID=A0A504JA79_9FLAO|nr:ribonuclease E activity regulator RraA [Aquimarina algicola]TPN84768.1 ribonuclease E activity regulator RraA [Aquimarina algicola]